MMDLSNLCIHTITNKPWSLRQALEAYTEKGIGGISVWEQDIRNSTAKNAGELIRQFPIQVVSYVRGGFFADISSSQRDQSVEWNKSMIIEAAEIGAPLLVLVCGAHPDQSLEQSRKQIQQGIEQILPVAQEYNIRLGIEPLHPMYAYKRSAINTLTQANDLVEDINDVLLGVVIDVYHLWWDPLLKPEIFRAGQSGKIFGLHICDYKMPMNDILNDRGLMGEGCINVTQIMNWVYEAGFTGMTEVEIFSDKYWAMDQEKFLDLIVDAYRKII